MFGFNNIPLHDIFVIVLFIFSLTKTFILAPYNKTSPLVSRQYPHPTVSAHFQ